jgi:hypothetical protein
VGPTDEQKSDVMKSLAECLEMRHNRAMEDTTQSSFFIRYPSAETSGTCSIIQKNAYTILIGKLNDQRLLGDLIVDGRVK